MFKLRFKINMKFSSRNFKIKKKYEKYKKTNMEYFVEQIVSKTRLSRSNPL